MSRDNEDEFETMGRVIETIFADTYGMIEGSLFDLESRSLRPLFTLDVSDDMVTATFDLPGVNRDEVTITCTEDTISVDAEMARPVKMRVSRIRDVQEEFAKYSKKVLLPVRVDPSKGSAKFRNGIMVVKLPRFREGKSVRIETGSKAKRSRQ
ncbi:MAG: Hsp20/alpha crystallin family protein [Thaumarchaeota archaeon]|nr:Hsp20/alpha crystallin family protein [Nitrososphaerota archaeon]